MNVRHVETPLGPARCGTERRVHGQFETGSKRQLDKRQLFLIIKQGSPEGLRTAMPPNLFIAIRPFFSEVGVDGTAHQKPHKGTLPVIPIRGPCGGAIAIDPSSFLTTPELTQ